jgi:ribokinase
MGRVVVLGSLNVDLVAVVDRQPRPGETVLAQEDLRRYAGGKGANQAVAAAEAGAQVAMVGAVGDDDAGRAYVARLERRGIDVSRVRVVPGQPTGQAWITVSDTDAENMIVVVPGANAHVGELELELADGDVLLAQLEVPLAVVAAAASGAHAAGARVVLNAAPYAALPPDLAAVANPVVVNEHEALLLADSEVVPRSLLVTFGGAGCSWDGEELEGTPVPDDELVDSTGGGDAFCGALAAALADGAGRREAMERAAAAGAAAVRRLGAQPDPAL